LSSTYLFSLKAERRIAAGSASVVIHSDTLAAALRCVSEETGILREVFADPEHAPEHAATARPPLRVSSVFPQAGGVRLYPRPLAVPRRLAADGETGRTSLERSWERLEQVSEDRLESLAGGRRVRFEPEDLVEDRVWAMPSERSLAGLPRPEPVRGVAVDRAAGAVSRFTRPRLALPPGVNLFFLARFEDPHLLGHFKELVARLGEAGLGAGRAAGAGHFDLAGAHPAPAFLAREGGPDGGEGAGALLLSLYLPAREEVARGDLAGASAALLKRGGWIHSGGPTGLKKRSVRMLVEGTVIARPAGRIEGEVRDVTPPGFDRHRVWRDGRAFTIPYRDPE
jgi:CRISPR type III-A-associated RAMP protein Csm4